MTKKVIGIAAALVLCAALVLPLNAQTSLLHEDFEGSIPPAGWSITTEAGSNQWYNETHGYIGGNHTGGGGHCAANDDDYFGYVYIRNNSIESSAFDASTYTEVWLAFNYTWEDFEGTEHAYVDVFNGSSWAQVKEVSVNGWLSGTRDSVDISAQAGGVANAQVRFRYDEDGGWGWAYWYLVDAVDVWGGAGGGPACVTILEEDFESSWSTTSPPPGWTIHYDGGYVKDSDWHRQYAHGSYCAYMFFYPSTIGTDELISPVIDCSSYGAVYLAVSHEYNHFFDPYTAQWLGSTDGGSTWPHVIWDYMESSYPWTRDSLDISLWAAGESQVAINFYGNGNIWSINYWYVDDVKMVGCGGGGPSEDLDLEVIQIIRPRSEEEGGVSFRPACRILNNLDTATAKVRCTFKDLETREKVYEDVLNSVPLEQGYNILDAFKAFIPEANKEYTALFVVEHPDDIEQTNNAKDKHWTTFASTDVTPIVMLSPAPQQYNEFDPEATFEEHAGAESTVAALHCKIEDASDVVVYEEIVADQTFAAEESKNIKFPTVEDLENGTYTITFWATDERGGNISNPPLVETFEYSGIAEEPVAERTGLKVVGHTVNFSLEKASAVSIRIYDVTGNLVTTLVSGRRGAGSYTLTWNTTDVASGIYFVKMLTPEFSATGKMVVLY